MLRLILAVASLLIALRCAGAEQTAPAATAPADGLVADFSPGTSIGIGANGATVSIRSEDSPQGHHLQLLPKDGVAKAGQSYVRIRLPEDVSPAGHEALTAAVRASQAQQAPQAMKLSWLALDADRHPIFVRRFELRPGDQWVRLEQPLHTWRWDARRVGDWDDVRELALRIDSDGVTRVDLDDLRFEGQASDEKRIEWLLDVAFVQRPREFVADDGLLVATDAVDAFDEHDLRALHDNMRRTRAFVRRVFGAAVRPTDDHDAPATLLIFSDSAEYPAFFARLGEQWGVTIRAPRSQGYTVQDLAASTYRAELGTRRPVYLHESAHTVIARDLRLLTGNPAHSPLHEGLASYLQICVYPDSIDRAGFTEHFARPIHPSGEGFFRPLEKLFTEPITTRHYAQLASVVAYLIEREPELLRALAKGLSTGTSATEILQAHGSDWAALQERWLAWGKEEFANRADADAALFVRPEEFR